MRSRHFPFQRFQEQALRYSFLDGEVGFEADAARISRGDGGGLPPGLSA